MRTRPRARAEEQQLGGPKYKEGGRGCPQRACRSPALASQWVPGHGVPRESAEVVGQS